MVQVQVSYELNEDNTGDRLILDVFRQTMDADPAIHAKDWFNDQVQAEYIETTISDFRTELLNQFNDRLILLNVHAPSGA
ncbi:MAG: hypothetical protein FOGNACKC_00929 [Anaerolineae bacterium]|nr:hypothetical protein [Anaerolineae bacterium]